MVLSLLSECYVGISQWRERWHVWRNHHRRCGRRRRARCKGLWDAQLERQVLTLRDGRRITYFVDGTNIGGDEPNGKLYIFAFHAMFLSGNCFLMQEAPSSNYVLVCVNRPGYFGSSAVREDYSYDTFANDIEQLADSLGIDTFAVAGHSSGGPCALACAARLPQRVVAVGILAGDPEYAHSDVPDKRRFNAVCLGYVLPWLLRHLLWYILPLARNAVEGMVTDYALETAPYPFETESIVQPAVVYLGENDAVMPFAVTRHVHERMPNVQQLRVVPNVGHLGLLNDNVLHGFFTALTRVATTTRDTSEVDSETSLGPIAAEVAPTAAAASDELELGPTHYNDVV